MKHILKYKNRIIVGSLIIAVLAFVYCRGGNSPSHHRRNATEVQTPKIVHTQKPTDTPTSSPTAELPAAPKQEITKQGDESAEQNKPQKLNNTPISSPTAEPTAAPKQEITKQGDESAEQSKPQKTDTTPMTAEEKNEIAKQRTGTTQTEAVGDAEYPEQQGMEKPVNTATDNYQTASVPQDEPVHSEPQDVEIKDTALTCTLSVRCDTIVQNISWLEKEKAQIVPEDGVIFAEKEVTFYEGETVFNVLLREMKRNKIHFEYVNTPIYNSAYIEGIANLYEFDCGELSGWVYKVNDWFPNYGCSQYILKQGDKIEWLYTCDLGNDVGSRGGLQRDE